MVAVAEFSNGLKHVETTIQIDPSLQIPRQRPHLSIVEAGDTRKFSGMERSLNPKHHHTPSYIITHRTAKSHHESWILEIFQEQESLPTPGAALHFSEWNWTLNPTLGVVI